MTIKLTSWDVSMTIEGVSWDVQAWVWRQFSGANLGQFLIINVHPFGVGSSELLLWPRFPGAKQKPSRWIKYSYYNMFCLQIFDKREHKYIYDMCFLINMILDLFIFNFTDMYSVHLLWCFYFRVCQPCRDYFPQSWNTMKMFRKSARGVFLRRLRCFILVFLSPNLN